MTKTVLLTLGRLPKGLELARALAGAGCRVIVAEPFGWHLSKPSRAVARSYRVTAPNTDEAAYQRELLDIVSRERIDLIVPVSEEALHAARIVPHLPEGVQFYGPDHEGLVSLHDKKRFNADARAAGLRAPETVSGNSPEADRFVARHDYVVKPVDGCSGEGLRLCRKGDPLRAEDRRDGVILQQRIFGREISSQTISHEGRVLGTVLYEGLVHSGTVSCCFRRVDDVPAAEDWIAAYVRHRQHSGFIAFDFIVDAEGQPWPLECNPRLTSGLHFMNPDDVASCVLGAPPEHKVRLKPQRQFQEGHTTLTEAYGAFFRPREFLRRLGHMARSKDVLFTLRDPLPFFLMTPMSWPILRQVMFEGESFGTAATRDIVWHGRALVTEARQALSLGATDA